MSAQEVSSATAAVAATADLSAAATAAATEGEAVSIEEAEQTPTSTTRPTETQRRILGAARHSLESPELSSSAAAQSSAATATTTGDGATAAETADAAGAASSTAAAGGGWSTDHFSSPVVREREWVIMEASNGVKRFVLVKTGSTEFKFSKKVRCKVQSLVGASYGQVGAAFANGYARALRSRSFAGQRTNNRPFT